MSTRIIQKRRAVSPVIATVILIAVAVALGIAVAFWASGLTSSFSKYEKLGVNTQYAVANTGTSAAPGWIINLGGQNTGSSDATITQIQINGVPYTLVSSANTCTTPYTGSSTATSVCWGSGSGSVSLSAAPTSGTAVLSVPSGYSFQIQLYLSSTNPSNVASKVFSSGQTIQVTIITAAGNNYPASIVLP
jgi:flagellin-like protein